MRRGPKPAKSKVASKPPVARKSPKGDVSRVRDLEERLAAALEREADAQARETATAEILRVIASSPNDVQPVFDTIAENAQRLLRGWGALVVRFDGELLHVAGLRAGPGASEEPIRERFPQPVSQDTLNGVVVCDRAVKQIADVETDDDWISLREHARRQGWRANLGVPMLHDGQPIGAITVTRREPGAFSAHEVDLLKTFADQAVIAIENVRLFTETKEALEQRTATADILKVISSSPTDVQPVLDTVVATAVRLCGAYDARIWTLEGDRLVRAAGTGPLVERSSDWLPLDPALPSPRAFIEGRPVHFDDLAATVGAYPHLDTGVRLLGLQSGLATPLLREGKSIGVLAVRRQEAERLSDKQVDLLKTFADQAVIAIENVRLFTELEEKNKALTTAHGQVTEALEQQTATSDVLRVISSSPTDVQPVFDSIAASALRLCDARLCTVFRFDGELIHLVALQQVSTEGAAAYRDAYPARPGRGGGTHRAILTGGIVHIPDIRDDPEYELQDLARANQFGCVLSVPMFRDGHPIGAITVGREAVRSFSDAQIELLRTFADQAVIAIENVRLFTETKEALERQTATSEILRVIASSPTEIQPVLDAIAENAARVCGANDAVIYRIEQGDVTRIVAGYGPIPKRRLGEQGRNLIRESITGRAMLERQTVHVHDLQSEEGDEFPFSRKLQRQLSNQTRTVLATPLLRDDVSIGAILIRRAEVQPFTDRQIALLQTFADQAVIAIENVRLFNETREALERQTATSEILRVISSSPTDLRPVFEAIAASATRLCEADLSDLYQFDGALIHFAAQHGSTSEEIEAPRQAFPQPPGRASVSARAILDATVVQVPDVREDPEMADALRRLFRTVMAVPMLREGRPLGTITVARRAVRPFSDAHIALLKTFADQAVIAIENVRLFTELQEKNRALTQANAQVTEALEQQTATSEILRVISSSPTDVQPVFDVIVQSAVRLCGGLHSNVYRVEDGYIHLVAHHNFSPAALEDLQRRLPIPVTQVEGLAPRVIREGILVHLHDAQTDPGVPETTRRTTRALGARSVLYVPMLRDRVGIGVIVVSRAEVKPFSNKEIALIRTFADQAAIAIENVRLFKELEARNHALTESLDQQTATSEILRVISSSPTDTQPVFDAIAESAARLCNANDAQVLRVEGDILHLVAARGTTSMPSVRQLTRGHLVGRAVIDRKTIHVRDLAQALAEYPETTAPQYGVQSALAIPLMREGVALGVIRISRTEIRPFTEAQVALLQTFADQAVIAIENVRLFNETKEALERQTATSEILQVISSSPTDVQPVFETILARAVELCGAREGSLFRFDGELLHASAHHDVPAATLEILRCDYPMPPSEGYISGRAILARQIVTIEDVLADERYESTAPHAGGFRSMVGVPLLRDSNPVGVIVIVRSDPGPFTDRQIALLKTFADQAVIAIENVRLFTALQARTQELTRSVGQLTALGEVGRAVSSTLDLEAVLSTIVSRAIQLSGTDGGSVYEYDEATEEFSLRASRDLPEAYVEQVRDTRPRKGEGAVGRVAQTREPVQIADISDPAAYESRVRNTLLQIGLRALLAVPLIAEDRLVGALIVMRKRTGTFAAEEVTLLQTFATQSALAIQNARLFREIEDKSRQLEVASQHKSEFLANMSHELRTPLNAIIGFSEVLSDRMFGELNEKQDEYLKDIYASGTHLLSLINDILDLSKIEAGRMELELTEFDLPTAIENALTLVRERAGRRSIGLHTSIDNRLGQIQADERKVRQVVLNLLSNAIKFTREGGRIEVAAAPKDGSVEVSVSDTGVGIAPEDQEAVFEEFRQVGTADKKVEGTGLGLTLCRKFVELHGGRIWVKSQLGAGSTFTFSLPLRRA